MKPFSLAINLSYRLLLIIKFNMVCFTNLPCIESIDKQSGFVIRTRTVIQYTKCKHPATDKFMAFPT